MSYKSNTLSETLQHNYKTHIIESKEQFDSIYDTFYKESIITSGEQQIVHHIGLDCEYISLDTYNQTLRPKQWVKKLDKVIVCKLQIACDKLVLVIDLCKMGPIMPKELTNILISASWIKTGVDVTNDIDYLSKNYELEQVAGGIIDVKQLAQLCGCLNPNLENIYSKLYNTEYKKHREYTNVDWSKELTLEMIKYCAEDAYISYKIGNKILKNIKTSFTSALQTNKQQTEFTTDIIISSMETNWIGRLQELAQEKNEALPKYLELPSDNGLFVVKCISFDGRTGIGKDKTKKGAKQNAAKLLLTKN